MSENNTSDKTNTITDEVNTSSSIAQAQSQRKTKLSDLSPSARAKQREQRKRLKKQQEKLNETPYYQETLIPINKIAPEVELPLYLKTLTFPMTLNIRALIENTYSDQFKTSQQITYKDYLFTYAYILSHRTYNSLGHFIGSYIDFCNEYFSKMYNSRSASIRPAKIANYKKETEHMFNCDLGAVQTTMLKNSYITSVVNEITDNKKRDIYEPFTMNEYYFNFILNADITSTSKTTVFMLLCVLLSVFENGERGLIVNNAQHDIDDSNSRYIGDIQVNHTNNTIFIRYPYLVDAIAQLTSTIKSTSTDKEKYTRKALLILNKLGFLNYLVVAPRSIRIFANNNGTRQPSNLTYLLINLNGSNDNNNTNNSLSDDELVTLAEEKQILLKRRDKHEEKQKAKAKKEAASI